MKTQKKMMIDWKEVISIIERANSIGIFPHLDADGDAIGSSYALAYELKSLGKEVIVYLEEEIQDLLTFLKIDGIETYVYKDPSAYKRLDLSISLDSGTKDRLGKRRGLFDLAKESMKIDHHLAGQDFAKYNYVDTSYAAVAIGIWDLIKELKGQVSKEAALRIYVGIHTDTGGFAYSNTDTRAHVIAGEIIDMLGDLSYVSRHFALKTHSKMRLYNIIHSKLEFFLEGKVAYFYISAKELEKVDSKLEETEGISSYLRDIEGVDTSVFVKGIDKRHFKVSLRSYELIDVAKSARSFNGGGHKRAAGFSYYGSEPSLKKEIIERLKKEIDGRDS